VYTINKGAFEQDVVITGPINPADYGFPTNTTRVQIYTEFFNAPAPERMRCPLRVEPDPAIRQAMATPDLVDDVLGFGRFTLGTGKALLAGYTSESSPLVAKEFVTRENRTFLIESVEYGSLYPGKTQASISKKKRDSRNVANVAVPAAISGKPGSKASKPRT